MLKSSFDFARPPIHHVGDINFPLVEESKLSNDIPVYFVRGGDLPIVKMEIVIQAGRPFESKKLAATVCSGLLKEGSSNYSSLKIAEKIDHYGATLAFPFSFDQLTVQLYTLTKHLHDLIPVLSDIIINPVFPESELQWYKKRAAQRLALDLAQNEIVAFRKATELYFGAQHPYGYNSDADLYEAVKQDDLFEHHLQTIGPDRTRIFMAGNPPNDVSMMLDEHLGQWDKSTRLIKPNLPKRVDSIDRLEEDLGHSQSAVRIGRRLFTNVHPDFPVMLLLNTLLGGYFGSRLMKNIREEKGYTYGIHAGLETMHYDGYFSISLETDKRHCSNSIKEIHNEIKDLQRELVTSNELEMVKNYLCGHVLSKMDGPLQALGLVRKNILMNRPHDFTQKVLQEVRSATAEQVRQMANKYLNLEELTTVVIH